MTTNILLLTFGGILLLVAVTGGGFELKELKIPKIGGGGRILAAGIGFMFLILGLNASLNQTSTSTREQPATADQNRLSTDSSSNSPSATPASPSATPASEDGSPPSVPRPSKKQIRFVIRDHLTAGLVQEQITIFLNGQNMGTLVTTNHAPSTKISVTVPAEGIYNYGISALGVAEQGGMRYSVSGAWQGEISITNGKVFEIMFLSPGNMARQEVNE